MLSHDSNGLSEDGEKTETCLNGVFNACRL